MFRVNLDKTYQQIKGVEIQGATAVAEATLLALKEYGLKVPANSVEAWLGKVREAADFLRSARPTEALADNAVASVLWDKNFEKITTVAEARNRLEKEVVDFLLLINQGRDDITAFGQELIKNYHKIFTHCHSSTVVNILIAGHQSGLQFEVFNTETRPLFQGRITAERLVKAGIAVTMVKDSAASFFLSDVSGPDYQMDVFLIGADAILQDGSVVNKIGSYGMALGASQAGVPIYVAASLLKFHPESRIEIEQRPPTEIWNNPPRGLQILNYAFDRIPVELITGYITEQGVIKPNQLKAAVNKYCPWIKT